MGKNSNNTEVKFGPGEVLEIYHIIVLIREGN